MDSRLERMEEMHRETLAELERMSLEIKKLQTICSRMDNHISFVETTYDRFKYPLDVVKNKVESLFGRAITNPEVD